MDESAGPVAAVNRDTRELVVAMKRMHAALFEAAVNMALEALSPEKQTELGDLLVELGEWVLRHAREMPGPVVESSADPVSEGENGPTQGLPPGPPAPTVE